LNKKNKRIALVAMVVTGGLCLLTIIALVTSHVIAKRAWKKQKSTWMQTAFGEVWDKKYPYLGPMPYGWRWSDDWSFYPTDLQSKWEGARITAISEINAYMKARHKWGPAWVHHKDPASRTVVTIQPAPGAPSKQDDGLTGTGWYANGQKCQLIQALESTESIKGKESMGQLVARWDRDSEKLISATIYICVWKVKAALGLLHKMDPSGYTQGIKYIKEMGVMKHELFHPIIGLKHTSWKCLLMCKSPTATGIGASTSEVVDLILENHRDSMKTRGP